MYAMTERERDQVEQEWQEHWRSGSIQGHLDSAEQARKRGDQIGYWHSMAEAKAAGGQYDESEECFKRAQEVARGQGCYGLLRNEVYALGEMLRRKGDTRSALDNFIRVAYMDYCNVSNNFEYQEEVRANGSALTPEFRDLDGLMLEPDRIMAPAVVDWISELSQDLAGKRLAELSLAVMKKLRDHLHLPFPPHDAWSCISEQLSHYKSEHAAKLQELEEEQGLNTKQLAIKRLESGGSWWDLRDVGRALVAAGEAMLARQCFDRAIAEASRINRTCETIYPAMGQQLLQEGKVRLALEHFLFAVHEYGIISQQNPSVDIEIPKYLHRDIAKAIKKLAGDPLTLKSDLINMALNEGHKGISERVVATFPNQ